MPQKCKFCTFVVLLSYINKNNLKATKMEALELEQIKLQIEQFETTMLKNLEIMSIVSIKYKEAQNFLFEHSTAKKGSYKDYVKGLNQMHFQEYIRIITSNAFRTDVSNVIANFSEALRQIIALQNSIANN